MTVKQISVFLENRSGKLAEVAEVLSSNGVNLRAASVAETEDFGIFRAIVDDVYKASTVLKDAGYVFSVKDVLAVELADEPGSFAKALKVLGDSGINMEYMYAFTSNVKGKVRIIMKTKDNKQAVEVLSKSGISTVSQDDLAEK